MMKSNSSKEDNAGSLTKRSALLEQIRNACLQRLEKSEESASITKAEDKTNYLRDEEINAHSVKRNANGDPVEKHNLNLRITNVLTLKTTEIKELEEESPLTTASDKMEIVPENVILVTNASVKQGILNETSVFQTSTTNVNEGTQDHQWKSQAPEPPADLPDRQPDPENFQMVLAGSITEIHTVQTNKRKKVQLEAPYTEPVFYDIQGNFVSPPLIPGRLPEAFESLPMFSEPRTEEANKTKMLWDFVGADMEEDEFEKLGMYCSTDNLRTGSEITMSTKEPCTGFSALAAIKEQLSSAAAGTDGDGPELNIVRRHRLLTARDRHQMFNKKLKYRGVRFLEPDPNAVEKSVKENLAQPLLPGKDTVFRVRIYRPFLYSPREKKRSDSNRHPLFVCDLLLLGRHSLADLRDRIACVNDEGLRIDLSERPQDEPQTSCKELFPSGFLCINNVFYVDRRAGCHDCSEPVRGWARRRGLGRFAVADMAAVGLHQLTVRLGYPEVYVHQGNCEHLFTFAEVRLLGLDEPRASLYPSNRSAASYNCVYCTTCAEYPANWVVVGSPRVPFDPALFCDSCFRLYMYKDGKKIGTFKAIQFKGNELETLTATL